MGTPEGVAAELLAFLAAGVETFIVSFAEVDEIDSLHILIEEVAPQLS